MRQTIFNILAISLAIVAAYKGHGYLTHDRNLLTYVGASVVKLMNAEHNAGGTGFVVKAKSGKSYTITNSHVCLLTRNGIMEASSNDDYRWYSIRVLELSGVTDLCILEAVPNKEPLQVSDKEVKIHEFFSVIGHPKLYPLTLAKGHVLTYTNLTLLLDINVTEAQCRGPNKYIKDSAPILKDLFAVMNLCFINMDSLFTNVLVYPGNSGSPAVDYYGNVIGVVFAGDPTTNFGYLVTREDLIDFLSIY